MDGNAIVLTSGTLHSARAKTTHGLIRSTSRYHIVGVIAPAEAGQDAGEVLDGQHRKIPVYASITDCMETITEKPEFCIIGVASKGGVLPADLKPIVIEAIQAGCSIVNGLHQYLSDMDDLRTLAERHQVRLIDIRKPRPKSELKFWSGSIRQVQCMRLAVLGTDCNLGKRTTTKFLTEALTGAGYKAEMIYTGQTGWMQGSQYGFIFDSTFNDFISGEIEHALVSCWEEAQPDIMLVEGQSALRNPTGPGGAEFLASGEIRHVVLQHAPSRKYFSGTEDIGGITIPSLESEVALISMYGAEVIGIALNTYELTHEEALAYKHQYQELLRIPVVLPIEEGVQDLLPVIKNSIQTFKA